jgi:hypothetical protein
MKTGENMNKTSKLGLQAGMVLLAVLAVGGSASAMVLEPCHVGVSYDPDETNLGIMDGHLHTDPGTSIEGQWLACIP